MDERNRFMTLEFEAVFPEHLDELVRIRIAAMHDSLTRVGRFDPDRARERFASGFNPEYTRFISFGGLRVGLVVVKPEADGLKLEHLYIEPEYQGRGIGGEVLQTLFSTADQLSLPISVTALRGSDSNSFYKRHGFKYQDETEWDINYIRMPSTH
jgi:GNAT superfamily N-acetyltransferase